MSIKTLEKDELSELVKKHLPNTIVEGCLDVWRDDLTERQLQTILDTITQKGYDREALRVLESLDPAPRSISYLLEGLPYYASTTTFQVFDHRQERRPGYSAHISTRSAPTPCQDDIQLTFSNIR
jgi:hypothetical protein